MNEVILLTAMGKATAVGGRWLSPNRLLTAFLNREFPVVRGDDYSPSIEFDAASAAVAAGVGMISTIAQDPYLEDVEY